MQSASVISAGLATHPQSDKRRLRVTVDREYAVAGEHYPTTDVWVEESAPVPAFGDVIQWGTHHVWIHGQRFRKAEYDSRSDKPLG